MSLQIPATSGIKAILFDMNGTLRIREAHEPTQRAAIKRMLEFLKKDDASEVDWEAITLRQKAYGDWAQENLLQLSEEEIWTSWILPDYPREQIEPVAAELTLAWGERKGRPIPSPGAEAALTELKRRGYRLGIISNTMSTLDIPRSLKTFGWYEYFDVMILSSALKIRKPAPEPFQQAARGMNLQPGCCAYLGNRISRDMVGCKQAGFALGLIIEPTGKPRSDEQGQAIAPDAVIHSLVDLLEIFPSRVMGMEYA